MEWVETTGRTVQEATEHALDQLGVDENDAEVVVLEESRSGFLGLGRADARIRARVRPAARRAGHARSSRERGRDDAVLQQCVVPMAQGLQRSQARRVL